MKRIIATGKQRSDVRGVVQYEDGGAQVTQNWRRWTEEMQRRQSGEREVWEVIDSRHEAAQKEEENNG